MIIKPTVFVIGAGASLPYGLPLGIDLATRVCTKVAADDFQRELKGMGIAVDRAAAKNLIYAFRQSGCNSLDEFVQSEGNRQYLELVKAGIVEILTRMEFDAWLYPELNKKKSLTDVDWVAYLFGHLRTPNIDDVPRNTVKFVTFNFDRSFERKLFMLLRSSYGVPDAVAAEIRSRIPILHLHGCLGGEQWCLNRDAGARAYEPKASVDQKRAAIDAIRIVHEEVSKELTATALDWLKAAHTICFLGFGYHRTNMERLRMRTDPRPNTRVFGTAWGLSGPEVMRVRQLISSPQIELFNQHTAYGLLKHTNVLQTDLD